PYTATADPEWLIYDAAFSPPPYPYQARPPGLTFAHLHLAPRVDGTPLDWAFPQTDRAFLFVRIDDQPEADAVQDGFCLAPIELDAGAQFRVYGTLTTHASDFSFLVSQNLSPCSDGNLSIVGLKQACVPPGM